jgi:ubiquinone/menaquinone biosynthesis C-methylase UbiE
MAEAAEADPFKQQHLTAWAHSADAWRRWCDKIAYQGREATDLLVEAAALGPGLEVLDLASGTGEPALSLAAAMPGAEVTATDINSDVLEVIAERGRARGLANLRVAPADIEDLPFEDGRFDRVTCRFGVMFCPDERKAFREIRRVLKDGGTLALLVWAAPERFPTKRNHRKWISILARHAASAAGPRHRFGRLAGRALAASARLVQRLPPPGPFRFGAPGSITAALDRAGFRDVREQPVLLHFRWPGSPEEAWRAQKEVLPDVVQEHWDAIAEADRPAVEREILDEYRRNFDAGEVRTEAWAYLIRARAG